MCKGHQSQVLQDVHRSKVLSSGARDVESLLVDSLIHKLIDDGLRDRLWLAHHLLLEEDLLPV